MHSAAREFEFNLTVKRNCSISPRGLLWLLLSLVLLVSVIAIGFAVQGAWVILPFAGLELVVLIAAFYVNGRHATDCERIVLSKGRLIVEVRDAERVARYEFHPCSVSLRERTDHAEYHALLCSAGREIEIGRHWDAPRRQELVRQLRRRLSNY